jgi:PhnB protein
VTTAMEQQKVGLLLDMTVSEAAKAVDFYTSVFDAVQIGRECLLDGQLVQAELAVGDYLLTVSAWCEAAHVHQPEGADNTAPLTFESDDVDSLLRRAAAAGARIGRWPGDATESAIVHDPAGLRWTIRGSHRPSLPVGTSRLPGTEGPDRAAGHCAG